MKIDISTIQCYFFQKLKISYQSLAVSNGMPIFIFHISYCRVGELKKPPIAIFLIEMKGRFYYMADVTSRLLN